MQLLLCNYLSRSIIFVIFIFDIQEVTELKRRIQAHQYLRGEKVQSQSFPFTLINICIPVTPLNMHLSILEQLILKQQKLFSNVNVYFILLLQGPTRYSLLLLISRYHLQLNVAYNKAHISRQLFIIDSHSSVSYFHQKSLLFNWLMNLASFFQLMT